MHCIFFIYANQTILSEIASIPEESLAMAQNLARQREKVFAHNWVTIFRLIIKHTISCRLHLRFLWSTFKKTWCAWQSNLQINKLHKHLHCEKYLVISQTHFKLIFLIESFYENQSTLFSIHFDFIRNITLNNKLVKRHEVVVLMAEMNWTDTSIDT